MEDKHIYFNMPENQLAHIYEPETGLFIAESPVVVERAIAAGYEAEAFLLEAGDVFESEEVQGLVKSCPKASVLLEPIEVIRNMTGYNLTRGVLCAMRRKKLPTVEEVCKGASRIAILDDVENPTNIGAIFRSAAALGIDAVILTKGCCDPLYRRAIRVSVGNVFLIPWTFAESVEDIRKLGFKIVAMALRDDNILLDDPRLKEENKLAITLGNEGVGLKQDTIDNSDYCVKIPMANEVDSLNVSTAAAIAFWELRNKVSEEIL